MKFVSGLMVLFITSLISIESCPCSNIEYCKQITTTPKKEVYLFTANPSNFYLFDFSKVTTVAVFGDFNNDLLCYAHSKNIRVVLKAFIPFDQLLNKTQQIIWIEEQLLNVKYNFADGINIDVEYPISKGSKEYYAFTEWIEETTRIFHESLPNSQVSIDMIWSPDCVAGRCYDYLAIAKVVDFLVLMAYDQEGAVNGSRYQRKPNSDLITTAQGVRRYIDLGVKEEKLVVAFPWYGYDYTCITNSFTNCKVDYKNPLIKNKLNNAGIARCYSTIMQIDSPQRIGDINFDIISYSKYLNYINSSNEFHQVWFDDPMSLKYKYSFFIKVFDVRGIGVWKGDCALTNDFHGQLMWNALPVF